MVCDMFCYIFSNLDADGFQPGKVEPTDKWEGEDEDDDIKDAWDKSDSEDDISKDSNSGENKITKTKPKKKLADKIAEREALKEVSGQDSLWKAGQPHCCCRTSRPWCHDDASQPTECPSVHCGIQRRDIVI